MLQSTIRRCAFEAVLSSCAHTKSHTSRPRGYLYAREKVAFRRMPPMRSWHEVRDRGDAWPEDCPVNCTALYRTSAASARRAVLHYTVLNEKTPAHMGCQHLRNMPLARASFERPRYGNRQRARGGAEEAKGGLCQGGRARGSAVGMLQRTLRRRVGNESVTGRAEVA